MIHHVRLLMLAALLATGGHLAAQAPGPEEDIRGPKPLVEIPVEKKPPVALWAGIGGGVLLLALAIFLGKKHAQKRRMKSPPEVAIASLADLEATRESLAAEEFANRAAQTVRQYIAARFGLAAPRRTTEEFLHSLANDAKSPLATEGDQLRRFLKSCDLAKFAGSNLDTDQRVELVDAARGLVRATSKAVPS